VSLFFDKMYRVVKQAGLSEDVTETYSQILAAEFETEQIKDVENKFHSFQKKVAGFEFTQINEFMDYVSFAYSDLKLVFDSVFEKKHESMLKTIQKTHDDEVDLMCEGGVAGYRLNNYTILSDYLDGVKPGLHIIAADPNCGKTALSSDLAIDILNSNKRGKIHYYTIDDPKRSIVHRMLATMSNRPINTVNRKRNPADETPVNKAYCDLIRFASEKRLSIFDSSDFSSAEQLMDHISKSRNEVEDLIVIVDGVTNLTIDKRTDDYHTELAMMFKESWKPNMKGDPSIPIIITNELRKREGSRKPFPEDIKGSRKWEYAADSVLLLYANDKEKFNKKEDMRTIIDVAKNKFNHKRGAIYMEFVPELSKFKSIMYGESF